MPDLRLRQLLCTALLVNSCAAFAIDKIAFEYGSSAGDANIDRYGAVATLDWAAHWLPTGSWYLGGYWEAGVNFWDSNPGRTGNDSLVDVYAMPVFRWQRDPAAGFAPFLELGVGPHGHTESKI